MLPLRRRDGSGNVAQKSDFTFFQFLSRLFLHISLLSKIGEAPYSWIASILIQVKVVVLPSKPIVFFFNVLVAIASLDRRKVPFSPGTLASFRSSLLSTRKVTYRIEEATNGNTSAFAGYSDICQCLRPSMMRLADLSFNRVFIIVELMHYLPIYFSNSLKNCFRRRGTGKNKLTVFY